MSFKETLKIGRPRSDAEVIARGRVLLSLLIIFCLSLAFLSLGENFIAQGRQTIWIRLATIPLFLLLLRRWLSLVRVRPPQIVLDARRLLELGRYQAAREKFLQAEAEIDQRTARRLNRARRLLQNGLSVDVQHELRLEAARCLLMLDEQVQAVSELRKLQKLIVHRADVAISLADELCRQGLEEEARLALEDSLPYFDAVDHQDLAQRPRLLALVGAKQLPAHSVFYRKIWRERALLLLISILALWQIIQLIFRIV